MKLGKSIPKSLTPYSKYTVSDRNASVLRIMSHISSNRHLWPVPKGLTPSRNQPRSDYHRLHQRDLPTRIYVIYEGHNDCISPSKKKSIGVALLCRG